MFERFPARRVKRFRGGKRVTDFHDLIMHPGFNNL